MSLPLATREALDKQVGLVESMDKQKLDEYCQKLFPLFYPELREHETIHDQRQWAIAMLGVHHLLSSKEYSLSMKDDPPSNWKKVCDHGLKLTDGDEEKAVRLIVKKMGEEKGLSDWKDSMVVRGRVRLRMAGKESGTVILKN